MYSCKVFHSRCTAVSKSSSRYSNKRTFKRQFQFLGLPRTQSGIFFYLYHHDDHFDVITKVAGFLRHSYFHQMQQRI